MVSRSLKVSLHGSPRKSHYTAAKGGLRAFTRSVARDAGPMGIRCNCIVPRIETELWRNWGKRVSAERGIAFEAWKAEFEALAALRMIPTPEDIGHLAIFLASDESRAITGQTINIDGGDVMVG